MNRRSLYIKNETSRLRSVLLGIAKSPGPVPTLDEAYDPKSIEFIKKGEYPNEDDMISEMSAFNDVLQKYGVEVLRPESIKDCNQIFTRDIGFVIDNKFILSNILPNREDELEGIQSILNQFPEESIIIPPEEVHVEGGDVMPWNDYIFVGTYSGEDYPEYITARTNIHAVDFITGLFPDKKVKSFDLIKSNTDPRKNALHLDCVFQPVGTNKAIIHKEGFIHEEDYQFLVDLFGMDNLFHITADEMYLMFSNVFSISPEVVVSENNFTRLNQWLESEGFIVERIPYHEISKQEGLLRCSTLPLLRDESNY